MTPLPPARSLRKTPAGLILAALLLGLGAASAPCRSAAGTAEVSLHEAARGRFAMGVGLSDQISAHPRDWPLLTSQFDTVTPENCLKPDPVQRAEGRFEFAQADDFVGFATRHHLKVVGHCLVWAKDDRTPGWFFQEGTHTAPREQLIARMRAHISAVAGRYRGRMAMWDVVNEALDDGTNYLRPSGWSRAAGEEFIAEAFRAARAADPGALLVYNDYNNELPAKRAKQVRLVKSLRNQGVPIDAVGLQGHYELDHVPFADIEAMLVEMEALGVKVIVSELDIDVIPRGGWWADGGRQREALSKLDPYREGCPADVLQRQAEQYARLFRLLVKHAETIARVSFWNLHDGQSWLNGFPWPRVNHPLLFDRAGQPKPAFDAVVSALGFPPSPREARRPVTVQSLLEEMVRPESVARWPAPEFTCRQASSYDRAERAPDQPGWFGNADNSQFIRVEEHDGRRERVMLDAEGPGAIVRFWLTTDAHRAGVLRFYFDREREPRLEIPGFDLLASGLGLGRPLLAPHANYAPDKPGGNTLYLPLPYAQHCKVTWEEREPGPMPPRYYQINYRTYAAGTPVRSFSTTELERARKGIQHANTRLLQPPAYTGGRDHRMRQQIAPGSLGTLDLPPGSAAVRQLTVKFSVQGDIESSLRASILRVTFDGEETVWTPLSDFFGSGVGTNEIRSWYRTVTPDGTMTCRWVMPYRKSARITVSNLGSRPVQVDLAARTSKWDWDARSMHFHASWRQECDIPVRPSRDWRYLGASGRGVLVGDTLAVFNNTRAWYGEGDEKIRVDGEAFPSHLGTGLEDYYNASWAPVILYHTPWANAVRADHISSVGHNTFTRTRNLDGIPFNTSLEFDMEIIHWSDAARVNFAATTYWYAFPGAVAAAPPSPAEATRPIPVAQLPVRFPGAIECESLPVTSHSPGLDATPQWMTPFGNGWSDDRQLLLPARQAGAFIEQRITAGRARRLTLHATKAADYGIVRVSVNGKPAREFDGYAESVLPTGPIDLGVWEPEAGAFLIRFEAIDANPMAKGFRYLIGLDCIIPSAP